MDRYKYMIAAPMGAAIFGGFDDGYNLMSLDVLEEFINKNGHLPDLPSTNEIVENGYNMVEMEGLLLKKIEELTLYTIELKRQLQNQKLLIESLKEK